MFIDLLLCKWSSLAQTRAQWVEARECCVIVWILPATGMIWMVGANTIDRIQWIKTAAMIT